MGRRKNDQNKQLKLKRETIRNLRDLPIDLLEGIQGGLGGGGAGGPPSRACPTGP